MRTRDVLKLLAQANAIVNHPLVDEQQRTWLLATPAMRALWHRLNLRPCPTPGCQRWIWRPRGGKWAARCGDCTRLRRNAKGRKGHADKRFERDLAEAVPQAPARCQCATPMLVHEDCETRCFKCTRAIPLPPIVVWGWSDVVPTGGRLDALLIEARDRSRRETEDLMRVPRTVAGRRGTKVLPEYDFSDSQTEAYLIGEDVPESPDLREEIAWDDHLRGDAPPRYGSSPADRVRREFGTWQRWRGLTRWDYIPWRLRADADLAARRKTQGMGPTRRELGLVAEVLRGTDAEETLAIAGSGSHGYEDEAWQNLVAGATAAGSSGLVALDLITAVTAGDEALAREPVWGEDE